MKFCVTYLLALVLTLPAHAANYAVGIEAGQLKQETAMGFWLQFENFLIGFKTNFAQGPDSVYGRQETDLSYGPGGYLYRRHIGEATVSAFNFSYDFLSLVQDHTRIKLFLGPYFSQKDYCPEYYTSELEYYYNCPVRETDNDWGLDIRLHYDVVSNPTWALPLTVSATTQGDWMLGLGYKSYW